MQAQTCNNLLSNQVKQKELQIISGAVTTAEYNNTKFPQNRASIVQISFITLTFRSSIIALGIS
jgi:hypothetical protein